MNFNLANNGPVAVTIDGTKYLLPRFTRGDWIRWGAEIDADRADQATKGMTPDQRYRYLSVFPVMPLTRNELSRHAFTEAGVVRILRTCMERAKVPADVVNRFVEDVPQAAQDALALVLASIVDPATLEGQPDEPEQQQGGQNDPLPSAASA